MGLLVKKFKQGVASFPSSVSLFDLKARFFVPTCASRTSARAKLARLAVAPTLAACSALCPAWPVGMTIRGEPAFGRGSIAPQPCIR